ncbi:MAG: flavin reductase [Phaeodactylibacter sp.]|nr:flavin reductase [Phaeodactylibacter sp.]MCB9050257.1 flavin reductase [Lewinellaceae bacterium]
MTTPKSNIIKLDTSSSIWERFFTVAPLVVIGTKEPNGYSLAPKHMATPLGQDNFFGFVCTPRHSTYHNVAREGFFTVSFPKPNQVVLASLAASPRCEQEGNEKLIMKGLPFLMASSIDAPFLEDSYLFFECEHLNTIDGFGQYSLICGRITSALVEEAYLRTAEKDEQEQIYRSPLLAYLAYGRFAEIRESLAFPFPRDFKN